jgi:hypothetical protein
MLCFERVPAPLIYPGGQGYMNPSPIVAKESYPSITRVVSFRTDEASPQQR